MDAQEKHLLNLIGRSLFVLEADCDDVPRYAAYNSHALNSIGKSEEDVIGLTARELFPGRVGELAFVQQVEVLRTRKERSYEHVLPTAEGPRLVLTRLTPDKDGKGNVGRLIGESTYVSSQQMIEKLRPNAPTINSEMENFVYLAAHDLRVPMRHVISIADELCVDLQDSDDEKLELIYMLKDIGTKAMSLIGDVLTHAQTNNLKNECVEFGLPELLQEIMGVLDPKGRCKISVPKARIKGDRTATQMILRNLIDNAIKASNARTIADEGASILRLALSVSLAGGFVEIGVQDSGCGFGDTATVFLNGGKFTADSGFGMLGVRRLIHSRGGTLMATNAHEGSGAIVSFSLPGMVCRDLTNGSEGLRLTA